MDLATDRGGRTASTPFAGFVRQILRLGAAGATAWLIDQGFDAALAEQVSTAVFAGMVGSFLPIFAAVGKKLRNDGNPLGQLL